ncbi:MAG: hypothetical protein ACTSWY_03830 [Promethearchaeota archaeon]
MEKKTKAPISTHNKTIMGPLKKRVLESIKNLPNSRKKAIMGTLFFRALYPDEIIYQRELYNEDLSVKSNEITNPIKT